MTAPIVRKIPKIMLPEVATAPEKTQTVAGFANDQEGICPLCKTPMRLAVANGVDVLVCLNHRVAMPIKNEGI